ncbi:hypothetical protein [Kriegella aquimaris]|uniref:Histidine kinase N-terminal 7TM region domain-containing protein n=1 Tax=Kriegella aquimaris TaxID=192904 RepID=A0A1G9RLD4_9FLAO|nr:hypothetical protein [Kriegella aquimaris]SDM23235.1 hypothetical protein SAMN04488514_106166 [Kriegella aquimaris]
MYLSLLDLILENSFIPFYGITLILSISRYSKYYDTPLKYLPIIVLYTFLNEILGYFVLNYEEYALIFDDAYDSYTVVIYNIYNVFFYCYFFYLFWSYIESKKHRDIILIGGIVFLIVAAINPFFQNILIENQVLTYVVGGLILILSVLFYLIQARSEKNNLKLRNNILGWLSAGLLIFYSGYIPIKIYRYINSLNGVGEASYVRRIQLSLIAAMYLCFIIGLLRMKRRLPPSVKQREQMELS